MDDDGARPPDSRPTAGAEPAAAARRRAPLYTALAVVTALVLVAAFVLLRSRHDAPSNAEPAAEATTSSSVPLTTAEIYQQVLPSMVLVSVDGAIDATSGEPSREGGGIGTGVIINEDGTILTANHVISGGGAVEVVFADGTRAAARVTTTEAATDMATLLPEALPEIVVPAVLGGAGLEVGDPVVAVGHPLGLTNSTTEGVVSALGRNVTAEDGIELHDLIQFDAAVNPGSSGGPLLDDGGRVVGIVTALVDPSKNGYFIGIGFAVPIGAALGGEDGDGPGGPEK